MTKSRLQLAFACGIFLLAGCAHNPESVLGTWAVSDPFFTAQYVLEKSEGKLAARVLYYNDGTQRYVLKGNSTKYLSRDLKWQNNTYVDGITGATQSSTSKPDICIAQIHSDTLRVQYAGKRTPHRETWIRVSKPNS